MGPALLLILALLGAPAPAEPGMPVAREVVVNGNTAFTRDRVLQVIHLRPGQRLYRDAAGTAQFLENRYHSSGFRAARVTGHFDEATGTLTLDVDEGRLAAVNVTGVDQDVADRVRALAHLPLGEPVRDKDLRSGLQRVEDASDGALHRADPGYTVGTGTQGTEATLAIEQRRRRIAITPYGTGTAPPFNRIDGVSPWVSLEATRFDPVDFNHLFVWARGTYGFSSEKAHWAVGGVKPFGPRRLVTLGYEAHDLVDSDDLHRATGFEQSPATMAPLQVAANYFGRRGHEGLVFVQPIDRLQLGVSYRADRYRTLIPSKPDLGSNPAIDEGDMRSLLFTARFATPGPLFEGLRRERASFLVRSPYGSRREGAQVLRLDTTLEVSTPGLGGDFDFQRLIVDTKLVRPLHPRLEGRLRSLVGWSWGDLPRQKQFTLGGMQALRGRAFAQFAGTHTSLLTAELAWLPTVRWVPGVVPFYDGGVAWTPGITGDGWRNDLGLGLEWPAGNTFFVRVDGAWAVDPLPFDDHRFRVTGRLRIPF